MEILGIGPGEFLFILIILLVAVGPERLPGLARQAGKLLVQGRNWLQKSPDAALLLRARAELEQELASIKASLLEVQSVRDEVLDAAKQLEGSVSSIASQKISLDDLTKDVGTISPRAAAPAVTAPISSVTIDATTTSANAELPTVEVPTMPPPVEATASNELVAETPAPVQPPAPQVKLDQYSVARQPTPRPAAPHANGAEFAAAQERTAAALEAVEQRMQALMADLHALQEQLKSRGALGDDWQPPSWSMTLDDTNNGAVEKEPAPVETEEAAR